MQKFSFRVVSFSLGCLFHCAPAYSLDSHSLESAPEQTRAAEEARISCDDPKMQARLIDTFDEVIRSRMSQYKKVKKRAVERMRNEPVKQMSMKYQTAKHLESQLAPLEARLSSLNKTGVRMTRINAAKRSAMQEHLKFMLEEHFRQASYPYRIGQGSLTPTSRAKVKEFEDQRNLRLENLAEARTPKQEWEFLRLELDWVLRAERSRLEQRLRLEEVNLAHAIDDGLNSSLLDEMRDQYSNLKYETENEVKELTDRIRGISCVR